MLKDTLWHRLPTEKNMLKFASWMMNENLLSRVKGRESLGMNTQAEKTEYSKARLQEH